MNNVLSTLKIGFDLDGVLALTDEASISWYQGRGLVGPEVTARDITRWDHTECLDVPAEAMKEIFEQPDFFAAIKPDLHATGISRLLKQHGAEVHIVTSRSVRTETVEWLDRNSVTYDRLEFASADEKPYYAGAFDLDFFFEDHPRTALNLASKVSRISFLRDKPYNQGAIPHRKLRRFYTWNEIDDFFRL